MYYCSYTNKYLKMFTDTPHRNTLWITKNTTFIALHNSIVCAFFFFEIAA